MGIHNDEVHVVPEGFHITASSPSCEVQGMENETEPGLASNSTQR